jgi:iron complex outermembrane receptor protein
MRSLPRHTLLSTALAVAFSTAPLWTASAFAQATDQATAPSFDIQVPAQPLAAALNELSRQTQTQVFAAGDLVSGVTSRAVSGRLTVDQALRDMLAGSSLQAVRTANQGYSIRRVENGQAASTLPLVTVSGEYGQETGTGPVRGLVARRGTTGTKTDTPIIETPQSISVIGAEEIETLKSQSLQDALGYVAGVNRAEGLDRTTESFFLRGFRTSGIGSIYRDGTFYTVNTFDGRQEPYGLERIEILKGASSVLYGASAPGGIINTVSKRPTADPLHELNVEVGNFGRKQISGDFGGKLDADGQWTYRITALTRDSNSFIDYIPDDRTYVAPALKWQPDAATSLTLLAEYQKDRTAYTYGLPASGTVLPNPNGQIPRNRFLGEPGRDRFSMERYTVGYLFEHAFNDRLKLRNSLRYFKMDAENAYTSIWQLAADQRTTASRAFLPRWDSSSAVVMDTSLQYEAQWGGVQHTLLAGFDYSLPEHRTERYTATLRGLDLYNPVYGSPIIGAVRPNLNSSIAFDMKRLGVYFQDQMKIADKWVVLLGGRHDSVRNTQSSVFVPGMSETDKSTAFTGRAGLVYLADNGLAPFISYTESFEPTSGVDRFGSRFKPTTGTQYEAGVRYQPKGSNTMVSAAVYQLSRRNILVPDPQDPLQNDIQAGEVRSRGFELEARTSIGRNTRLIAAYTYTDARTTEASPLQPEEVGKRSLGVPYNQLSVWGDYSFGDFGLPGLRIGAGVRYVGETRGLAHNTAVSVPSFTLVDAMVSYTTGPWRLALNFTNLADKTYVANCTYGCFYGEPRRVIGTATYRW